jgi:hypothetical protein
MTLIERIRRGEQAIEAAKAQGRDVAAWEQHLELLKREAFESPTRFSGGSPVCWNCVSPMSKTLDVYDRSWWVCWECAMTQ